MTSQTSSGLAAGWREKLQSRQEDYRLLWKRFARNRGAVLGLVVIVIIIFCTVFAPLLAPADPTLQDLSRQDELPNWQALMGADQLGRDIFSRILYGGRVALTVSFLSVGVAVVVGVAIGLVAAYIGGVLDEFLMRVMDVLLAFPYLLLAIAIVAAIGPGVLNTIVAVAVWLVPTYARLSRATALTVKRAAYVDAARAMGANPVGIIWRHLLPNCLTPIFVQTTLDCARAILMEAGLSFLGYGVQPPTPSWGSMISEGRDELLMAPHIATAPGLAILFTVLSLNLVGDGLRETFDSRSH